MQAEGSDAQTPRDFNTHSAKGHQRTGIARPVPRRRPPPRSPEPLWSLLVFHIRVNLWRALSWLFEVRSLQLLLPIPPSRPMSYGTVCSTQRSLAWYVARHVVLSHPQINTCRLQAAACAF